MINGFANFLFAYRMHSTLQIVRSEEHLRQTRSALKPLGFFGKLAYMGGLLFQVCADLWLLNVLLRWDFLQQYNETTNAFGRLRDILNDQFSDTATKGVSRRSMRRQLSHGFNCLLFFCLLTASGRSHNRRRWRDDDGKVSNFKSWVWQDCQQEFPRSSEVIQDWSCWC